MTIEELIKILYALNSVFSKTESKRLFIKLLHNIKDIIL